MSFRSILISGASGGLGSELLRQSASLWPEARIFAISSQPIEARDRVESLTLAPSDYESQLGPWLRERCSELDLVIHTVGALNASGARPEKSLREVSSSALNQTFTLNAVSTLMLGQAVHSLMKQNRRSVFMALSAKLGSIEDNQLGGWYSYRMSKAALNMGIRTMALEFGRKGSQAIVVAVHPGTTRTALSQDFIVHRKAESVAEPTQTAERLLALTMKLTSEQNGSFLHWDGSKIPW